MKFIVNNNHGSVLTLNFKQNGENIAENSNGFAILNDNKSLRVDSFEIRHQNGLQCVGLNRLGSINRRFYFEVNMTPRWSDFEPWTSCSVTCGSGFQERTRHCQTPDGRKTPDPRYCSGAEKEKRACQQQECSGWAEWGPWSACTKTCGTGYEVRHRTCNDPFNLGCDGETESYQYCHNDPCLE